MKKFRYALLAAALFLASIFNTSPVSAEDSAQSSSAPGSITVQLADTSANLPRGNVVMDLVKVADLVNGDYQLTDPFKDSGVDVNSLSTTADMENAAEKLHKLVPKLDGSSIQKEVTSDTGEAVFRDLDIGMYLLYASDLADYEFIVPALIAIPTWQDGTRIFDITCIPKHSNLPSLEITKVSSDGSIITGKEFAFAVYADSACRNLIVEKQGSTAKGTVILPLMAGKNYVKETTAPDGYVLSDQVLEIDVAGKDRVTLNGKEISTDDLLIRYIFTNTPEPASAPQTPSIPSARPGTAETYKAMFFGLTGCAALTFLSSMLLGRKKH